MPDTKRKIVVIDDEPVQLKLLERALGADGFEVVCVDSAIGATNTVARVAPALVILDLSMPAINGRELCKLLRKHPRTKDVPVLIWSAQPPEELAQAAAESGADAFLAKDADLAAVRAAVGRLAGRGSSGASQINERSWVEKRRERRHPMVAVVQLEIAGPGHRLEGYVGNISRGGVALYVDRIVSVQTPVRVALEGDPRSLPATVCWLRPVGDIFAVGIAFDDASGAERAAVDALLDEIEAVNTGAR